MDTKLLAFKRPEYSRDLDGNEPNNKPDGSELNPKGIVNGQADLRREEDVNLPVNLSLNKRKSKSISVKREFEYQEKSSLPSKKKAFTATSRSAIDDYLTTEDEKYIDLLRKLKINGSSNADSLYDSYLKDRLFQTRKNQLMTGKCADNEIIISDLLANKVIDLNQVPQELREPELLPIIMKSDGDKNIPADWLNSYFCDDLNVFSDFSDKFKRYFIKCHGTLSAFTKFCQRRSSIEKIPEEVKCPKFWGFYCDAVSCMQDEDKYEHLEGWLHRLPETLRSKKRYEKLLKGAGGPLGLVPEEYRTPELCWDVCRNLIRPGEIEHLKKNIGYDQWLLICEKIFGALEYIPREHIDESICWVACATHGVSFNYVPEEYRSIEMLRLACRTCPNLFLDASWVEVKDDYDLWVNLASIEPYSVVKQGFFNPRFPEKYKTTDFMINAIRLSSSGIDVNNLPKDLITRELLEVACLKTGEELRSAPPEMIDVELSKIACKASIHAFRFVPEHCRTKELYLNVLQADEAIEFSSNKKNDSVTMGPFWKEFGMRWRTLSPIPKQFLNRPLCKAVLKQGASLKYIPDRFKDRELCLISIEASIRGDNVKIDSQELLEVIGHIPPALWDEITRPCGNVSYPLTVPGEQEIEDSRTRLINALKCYMLQNSEKQREIMSCKKLNADIKQELLDFLWAPGKTSSFAVSPARLLTKDNPLLFKQYNPFATDLIMACYQARNFAPDHGHWVEHLEQFIAKSLKSTDANLPERSKPLPEGAVIVGGRTLKGVENGQQLYFKLQRQGEPLKVLMREGFVHQFMKANGALREHLRSDVPCFNSFIKIPVAQLPDLSKFHDSLAIVNIKGKEYVNAYCFQASPFYYSYAHTADSCAETPFDKPVQGIYKAMHDAAWLMNCGLLYTSPLPAFHDTGSGRRWIYLHGLLGYSNGADVHPGTFGGWNTTATQFPDIGWTGLRDYGDYQRYGNLNDYFIKTSDIARNTHPEGVIQRVCTANCMAEILLAGVLLRSRLYQDKPGYHFKNDNAVKELKNFIETAFNHFLTGLELDEPELKVLLQLNAGNYDQCLTRAAREILYWTARQPSENPGSETINQDCYSYDIQKGRLCPELYPYGDVQGKKYPEDFHNINGKLNLSANNTSFAPMTLTHIIFKLCAQVMRAKASTPEIRPPRENHGQWSD